MNLLLALILLVIVIICFIIFFPFRFLRDLLRGYGIPNLASQQGVIDTLISQIDLQNTDVFYDLGCGEGYVLAGIQQAFPINTCIGYEGAPFTYSKAIKKLEKENGDYTVLNKDFFGADLSDASIVYCYLLPHLMQKVWSKLQNECAPGTRLYANNFPIPGVDPTSKTLLTTQGEHEVYLYMYEAS